MIATSDQNLSYYPDNKPYHFKTKLQQNLIFSGKWKLALVEVGFTEKKSTNRECLYIYSDLCGETIINGSTAPLLRRVVVDTGKNAVFKSLYYFPVTKAETNEIEFVIKNDKGVLADHLQGAVTVVIHFRAYPFYI